MDYQKAVQIRKDLKRFWRNYKMLQKETIKLNSNNFAEYRIYPEVTNWKLVDFLLGRKNPNTSEEDEHNFALILNYKK